MLAAALRVDPAYDIALTRLISLLRSRPVHLPVELSADVSLLSSHSTDSVLVLGLKSGQTVKWEMGEQKTATELVPEHSAVVIAARMREDGGILLLDCSGKLRVVDSASEVTFVDLMPSTNKVPVFTKASIGRDDLIAATLGVEAELLLWNGPEFGEARNLGIEGVSAVGFSSSGRFLAALVSEPPNALLFDLEGQSLEPVALPHDGGAGRSVAFDPDERFLATAAFNCKVNIWKVEDVLGASKPQPLSTVGLPGRVSALAWSPTGGLLAIGLEHGSVFLWDADKQQMIGPTYQHGHEVSTMAFVSGGTHLVVAAAATLRLWDLSLPVAGIESPELQRSTSRPWPAYALPTRDSVYQVAFSADSQMIAAATIGAGDSWQERSKIIYCWYIDGLEPCGPPRRSEDMVSDLGFVSGTGQETLNSVDRNSSHTVTRWDPRTGSVVGEPWALEAFGGTIGSWGEDGLVILTTAAAESGGSRALLEHPPASDRGRLELDLGPLEQQSLASRGTRQGYVIDFRPGSFEIALAHGAQVNIWDMRTGSKVVGPLKLAVDTAAMDLDAMVTDVRYSHDGTHLITAFRGGTAVVWTAEGQRITPPLRHKGVARAVALSPDARLAFMAGDETLEIWDVENQKPIRPPITFESDDLDLLEISPDGHWAAVGYSFGKGITILDVSLPANATSFGLEGRNALAEAVELLVGRRYVQEDGSIGFIRSDHERIRELVEGSPEDFSQTLRNAFERGLWTPQSDGSVSLD